MMKTVRNKTSKFPTLLLLLLISISLQNIYAQLPADLPWSGVECDGETIILQGGIAAITCGVTTEVPVG